MEESDFVYPFMHNAGKWSNIILKSCSVNILILMR